MQKIVTTLIDDLDGSEIEEGWGGTVLFSLDGQEYEIDLKAENRHALVTALEPFTVKARKIVKKGRPGRKPNAAAASKPATK